MTSSILGSRFPKRSLLAAAAIFAALPFAAAEKGESEVDVEVGLEDSRAGELADLEAYLEDRGITMSKEGIADIFGRSQGREPADRLASGGSPDCLNNRQMRWDVRPPLHRI